jgi:TctA family transporter
MIRITDKKKLIIKRTSIPAQVLSRNIFVRNLIYIYLCKSSYIYVCVCVCVCVSSYILRKNEECRLFFERYLEFFLLLTNLKIVTPLFHDF